MKPTDKAASTHSHASFATIDATSQSKLAALRSHDQFGRPIVEEIKMHRQVVSYLALLVLLTACDATDGADESVYTLYRTSSGRDETVHVATFDATHGALFNRANCVLVAIALSNEGLANELEARSLSGTRFWCEDSASNVVDVEEFAEKTPAIQSAWVPISSADGISYYAHLASATRNGSIVTILVLTDYPSVQQQAGRSYLSEKGQWQVNCYAKTARQVSLEFTSGPFGSGDMVWSGPLERTFRPFSPDTVGAALVERACRRD